MPHVTFRDTSCPTLLADIELITKKLHISATEGSCPNSSRRKLLIAAQKLVAELEPPEDALERIVRAQSGLAALRQAFEMKLFEVWEDVEERRNVEELAAQTQVGRTLIVHTMRALIPIGIFAEIGEEERYKHTPLSTSLTDPTFRVRAIEMLGKSSLSASQPPDYRANSTLTLTPAATPEPVPSPPHSFLRIH